MTVFKSYIIINFVVASRDNKKVVYAEVAELADAQDLKSCGE